MTPPVITIVGYSDSGKTRVASYLINHFSTRGYRVAAIKHCHDGHDMDKPGSDTARFRESGASTVVASSPGQITTMQYGEDDATLEELLPLIGSSIDLVIVEGYKTSSFPKILVSGEKSCYPDVANVIAIVGHVRDQSVIPIYRFDGLDSLATQIQAQFLGTTDC